MRLRSLCLLIMLAITWASIVAMLRSVKEILAWPDHCSTSADRRALITGSSQGIGLALAQGLADHGAEIVLNGRDAGKLAAAAEALRAKGHKADIAAFDVTQHTAVTQGVADIEAGIGAIDILINNAGMQFRSPLEDFPAERWEQLLSTNISSVFYAGQAVARHMIKRGRGKIINIASVQSELARARHRPLHRDQGCRAQPHPRHVHRLGQTRPADQRHRARLFQDAAEPGTGGQPGFLHLAGQAAPLRGAGAMWKNWSVPRCSWPARPRRSSTATPFMWTAGSRRVCEVRRIPPTTVITGLVPVISLRGAVPSKRGCRDKPGNDKGFSGASLARLYTNSIVQGARLRCNEEI